MEEETEVQVANVPDLLNLIHPYLDETPRSILQRMYLIQSGSLTSGSAIKFNPWHLLSQKDSFKDLEKLFSYFRGDVKLKIVTRASAQQYGWFSLTFLPGVPITNTTYSVHMRRGGARLVLCSVASRDAVEYHCPYIYPNQFILLNVGEMEEVGTVYIDAHIVDSVSSDIPTAIDYEVYAAFENSVLAGLKNPEGAIAQMDNTVRTVATHVGVTSLAYGMSQLGYLEPMLNAFNSVTGAYKQAQPLIKGAEQVYGGLKNAESDNTEATSIRVSPYGDVSQSMYNEHNAYLLGKKNKARLMPSFMSDRNCTNIIDICKIPGPIRLFEISPTSTAEAWTVSPLPHRDLLFRLNEHSYLQMWSYFFRQWRGSIKVSVHLYTSPFVTGRLKISLRYGISTDTSAGNIWSDIITVQGDTMVTYQIPYLRKTTWADTFQIDGLVSSCGITPTFVVEKVGTLNSAGDRVPVIYGIQMISAGSDFQFRGFRHAMPVEAVEVAVAEAQCDVEALHANDFECINFGTLNTGVFQSFTDVEDVMDIMYRYSRRPSELGALSSQILQFGNSTEMAEMGMFDIIATCYRYYRGSMRFKFRAEPKTPADANKDFALQLRTGTRTPDNIPYLLRPANGLSMGNLQYFKILDVEVPFLCVNEFAETKVMAPLLAAAYNTESVGDIDLEMLLVSAGHDFVLSYVMPPLPFHWLPEVLAANYN